MTATSYPSSNLSFSPDPSAPYENPTQPSLRYSVPNTPDKRLGTLFDPAKIGLRRPFIRY